MKSPRIVREAQQFNFPMQITGYLLNVELLPNEALRGYVFSDTKGRFEDGTYISTAQVIDIRIDLPRHVARTVSDSYYVICNYSLASCSRRPVNGISIEFSDSQLH
ncbi:hypothetical protein [Stutzerimonas stutzeri]|uniref:Uncharacterized protein n=1 Tax=Stutzerimonas stutzeri TaxID=316 RepID=A0A6I6LRM6_STUST|nr:hypothetical protein [Stutzerimonas stutzeri]QGZ31155.1 hypothetical protein GQA94_14195 [Stutzerimonas stutzeri]